MGWLFGKRITLCCGVSRSPTAIEKPVNCHLLGNISKRLGPVYFYQQIVILSFWPFLQPYVGVGIGSLNIGHRNHKVPQSLYHIITYDLSSRACRQASLCYRLFVLRPCYIEMRFETQLIARQSSLLKQGTNFRKSGNIKLRGKCFQKR